MERQCDEQCYYRRVENRRAERHVFLFARQAVNTDGEHKYIHRNDIHRRVAGDLGVVRHERAYDRKPEEADISHDGGDGQNTVFCVVIFLFEKRINHQHEKHLKRKGYDKEQTHVSDVFAAEIGVQECVYNHAGRTYIDKHRRHR